MGKWVESQPAGRHQNQPPIPQATFLWAGWEGHLPSSLDSSLEKTILGFFFVVRCWVFGCRRVVRRGSGVTKSLSEAAEVRCWCLVTRKGRGMSPKDKKEPLSERRASLISPPIGLPYIPVDCFLADGVFWLLPWPISSSSIASNPLV